MIASSLWSPAVEAAPFTRDITSFLQLGANAGAQSPAGSYATAQIDNVTLEIWVLLSDTSGSHHVLINGNGGLNGYGLFLQAGGKVSVLMGNEGWVQETGTSVAANRWMHLAAVRDSGGGGTLGWRIYVDGQEKVTVQNAITGDGVPNALDGASYVQVGRSLGDPAGLSVSDARIWQRALTQSEIQANMSGAVATNAADLVGYWRFADGAGSTATDLQTNRAVLHLPISGAAAWIASTSGATTEDTALTGQLAGGDIGTSVTYAKASDPAHGAVVISASGSYTYTPVANYNGADSFTFTVNNGSVDSASCTANVTVSAVNDRPVLDNLESPALATIAEDTSAPTNGSTANSTLVSSLVDIGGALSNVVDVDSGAVTGIAVTAVSAQGSLYYTTNGGATWTAAGTVSSSSALLLAADANTRIAFVPEANLVGTDTDAITFRAWDRTFGSNGATGIDTRTLSAFSTATDLASVVITGRNDAPTINAGPYTLTGTNEDAAASSATRVDSIVTALSYADVDIGGILSKGIAVTTIATSTGGKWQYSTDGSTGWTDFGTVANNAALLLTSDTYVRYVPDGLDGETATFTFRGWDRTVTALASVNGTPRYADTSTNGGNSEFSSGTASASITVSSVNDAPVFVGGVTTLTVNENTGGTSIKALLHASDPDTGQTLTWSENAAPVHGTLAFSSATASTSGADITPGGTITYTPTANYVGSDSFTVQVSDGTASATRTINVTINVVATELRFTTQPSGSVSGVALTGQPVITATDASGNVDTSFVGTVTLALGSGAGALSGTLTKAAVAGVATFTDVAYTATADQQAFTLTTANTAGLTEATSNAATSNVVATKLRFSAQPAPLTMASTVTRTFTTAPVVQAVDAANVVDTDYSTAIVLSLTKNDGTAVAGTVNSVAATDDTDGSATTVTLTPISGAVTFSGLSARYTHAASTDSLALHATSGALVATNSAVITCREDAAPVVSTLITGGTFTEGGAAVAVSYAATVTDADDMTCAWATVSIAQNFTADQDVLSFTNDGTTMGNITAVYDAGTGVLTLTSAGATATKIQWGNAIRVVKYANTSHTPNTATRQMLFVANDGMLTSDAGYTYCKTNVTVIATNDAPTLSGGPFALNGTDENTMSTATTVSTILAGLTYADPDGSVASGIAITQKSGTGSWAYSTDGITWAAVGSVSSTSALLLTSTSHVRYAPNGSGGETATITFRGWDQTSGSASTNATRGLSDAGTNGGTTAFSAGTAQATIIVTAVDEPPPSTELQTITFGALADVTLGQTMTLSATASSGLPVTFSVVSGPATLSGRTLTTTGMGRVTVRATQSGNSSYDPAPAVERSFMVTAGLPPTPVVPPAIGGSATLTVPGSNAGLSYQWQRNGRSLAGATGAALSLSNVQPSTAGLYTYTAQTPGGAAGTSEPVIVGLSTNEKLVGTGSQAGADIRHPNGNIYDQLLLEGAGASFTADAGQVTRMSFVDLSDDIVQVEFSGAGTLSLVMDNAPAGAPAANYNQPGVNYVRGNVGIVITGANETSNVSVFSVGRANAVNQSLFRDGVAYDGVANVAFIAVQSTNGRFGGVYTGNVEYFASQGFTGLYAPGVAFAGPVNLGDIQGYDAAQPVLVVGSVSNVRIAGGSLAQPNGKSIQVEGLTHLTMAPGETSQGAALPAQANQGVLEQDGVDMTELIVR